MDDNQLFLILLAAAGLWLALQLGRLLAGVFQLQRMRFARRDCRLVDRAGMPAEIGAILDPLADQLAALGFVYETSLLVGSLLRSGDPQPAWLDIHVHRASGSRATVRLAEVPEPGLIAAVAFSAACNGQHLLTFNRALHQHLPYPPAWQAEDAGSASLEEQWRYHLRRLPVEADCPSETGDIPLEVRQLDDAMFRFWLDSAYMVGDGENFRLGFAGAWRYLRQVLAGNRRVAQLPPMRDVEAPALRVMADRLAWATQERLLAALGMPRGGKLLCFVVSAGLGIAALAWMTSPQAAVLLLAILLFHEFGHALMMRALGYRQLGVLVLPFLGAVALGRKDDAGPWQKLAVLLAGPVPGLLLAVVCLRLALAWPEHAGWLGEAGGMLLVINLFNLLPFTPLDGGQIVETFLFARRPRLRFGFFAVSALALILVGYQLESTVLAAAGLLLAVGIPFAWRRLALLRGLPETGASEAAVAALLDRLQAAPGPRWPAFSQRMQSVRMLLPLLRGRRPGLRESLAGVAIYLLALCSPLLALWDTPLAEQALVWAVRQGEAAAAELKPPEWQRQLAEAATPLARWQVLYDAGRWFEENERNDEARERFAAAWAEAGKLPADAASELPRLDTRIALARLDDDPTARYLELLPILRALPPAERERLATVLEALSWSEYQRPALRIGYLREAVEVREALPEIDNPYRLTGDRLELARLLDAAGDAEEAERLLHRNLVADDSGNAWVREPVAWFFLVHQRLDDAEKTLPPVASAGGPARVVPWLRLAQQRPAEAVAALERQLERLPRQRRSDWQRLEILLDLVHASDRQTGPEAKWLAQVAAAKEKLGDNFRYFRRGVRREAEGGAWESLRGKARMAVLGRLPGAEEDEREDAAARHSCR